MSPAALHARPRSRAVLGAQLRLLCRGREWEATGAALLLLGATVVEAVLLAKSSPEGAAALAARGAGWLAFLWPLGVWRGENTGGTAYHRAMPVERGWHDLARVAAGGAWLAAWLAMAACADVLAAVPTPGAWGPALAALGLLPCLAVAALTLYLLGSAPLLLSQSAGESWGASMLYWLIGVVLLAAGNVWPAGSAQPLLFHPLGLGTALLPLRGPDALAAVGVAGWLPAALLWLGVGAAGVVLAATRHRWLPRVSALFPAASGMPGSGS